MPSFDSSIGSKKILSSPLKEYDIPDGDQQISEEYNSENLQKLKEFQQSFQNQPQMEHQYQHVDPHDVELERSMRAAREAKRTGKERLSDGARRRIEILIGMTRLSRSIDISGNTFVFQTLKAREMREAITAASQFDGTIQSIFEIRKQLLARSIVQIAGVDIEQFIGSDTLDARLLFIEELDDTLSNRLYDEYLLLVKEAKNKYTIKTDEDAKEVMEDLKK